MQPSSPARLLNNMLNPYEEIKRLKAQEEALKENLRALRKGLELAQGTFSGLQGQIKQLDAILEPLRAEKLAFEQEITTLKCQKIAILEEIDKKERKIEEKIKELSKLIELNGEQILKLDATKSEIKSSQNKLNESLENLENSREEIDKSQRQLNLKIAEAKKEEEKRLKNLKALELALSNRNNELTEKAGLLTQDANRLKQYETSLLVKSRELETREYELKKKIKEVAEVEKTFAEREQKNNLDAYSNQKEKQAIDQLRKTVELEKLRVDKLAREKNVEKELAELRKEFNQ